MKNNVEEDLKIRASANQFSGETQQYTINKVFG